MIRSLTAMALGASTVLLASSALAQDPNAPATAPPPPAATSASSASSSSGTGLDHPVSVGLLLGYGINNMAPSGSDTFNAYGLGFGVRAGYTLPMKVYLGGTFIYHLGYSKTVSAGPFSVDVSGRVNPLGVEGGYDFAINDQISIRPFLGLGLAFFSSGGASDSKLALWPGVLATYNVTDQFYVGLDARYMVVTGVDTPAGGGSPNAIGFYANGGYRF